MGGLPGNENGARGVHTRMTDHRIQRLTWLALLSVGLLSGILLTIWLSPDAGPLERPQQVDRVEIGAQPGASTRIEVPSGMTDMAESGDVRYLDVLSLNEVFKQVAGSVTPAVVFIQVISDGPEEVLRRFGQQRGGGGRSQSAGSGVVLSADGYIVTNNHVVENASEIWVTLQDKRQFRAEVVGRDPTTDLAVIRVDGGDLPAVALGNADDVEVGEWVLAVGNPFRLTSTVTAGIVSALGRSVNVIDDQLGIESFIQTDAAINPGNSGGAVVNLHGELVGIATAIATESGSYEGYGFAVPVDLMERVVRDLIRYGEVRRGYLGVSILPVTALEAEQFGLPIVEGVLLQNVQRGLAGAEAGLRDGDIVLAVEGRPVFEPNELQSVIALYSPGDRISLRIWRGGEERTVPVVLKGRDDPAYDEWLSDLGGNAQQQVPIIPPPNVDIAELPEWGAGLVGLDARIRDQFGVAHGVFVAFVETDGPFSAAGLSRGHVITHMDGEQVFTLDDAVSRLQAAAERLDTDPGSEPVLVQVRRMDGAVLFFEVSL